MLKMLAAMYGLDEAFHLYEGIKHKVLEAWVDRARRVIEFAARVKRNIDRAWRYRIMACTLPMSKSETANMAWARRINAFA